ncbi:MAG TPA: helix-turn-helix domain-containing protein [Deltaproteobacteria bacterium]|nr:helix-turn-helix domain-containing protein [Deltaproteobacteria bacterium]
MNSHQIDNQQSFSFGRYLKSVRVEKGISLQTVAKETRIGLNTLLLIENEDIGKLPAEVFTKGFLRAYAKVIGADGDVAIHRYLSDNHAYQAAVKRENDLFKSGARFWPRFLLAFSLMGCIIALTLYFFNGFQFHTMGTQKETPLTIPEHQEAPAATEKSNPEPETDQNRMLPKLLLKVAAVKETWIKVQIDGQDSKEYQLKTGDHLELEASSGFNLLMGDAKGVELTLDDKPFKVSGKDGQVVTVQIP